LASLPLIPAKAGTQQDCDDAEIYLDSRFRGNERKKPLDVYAHAASMLELVLVRIDVRTSSAPQRRHA